MSGGITTVIQGSLLFLPVLSPEMTDRLVAFAKTATPNTADYETWEANGKSALVLGDEDTKMGNPSMLKLWVTLFTNKAPGE